MFARIVASWDISDALTSQRTNKDRWAEEAVIQHIRDQEGMHLDRGLVDVSSSIHDVIRAIRNTYGDHWTLGRTERRSEYLLIRVHCDQEVS